MEETDPTIHIAMVRRNKFCAKKRQGGDLSHLCAASNVRLHDGDSFMVDPARPLWCAGRPCRDSE